MPGEEGFAAVGSANGFGEVPRRIDVVQLGGLDERVERRCDFGRLRKATGVKATGARLMPTMSHEGVTALTRVGCIKRFRFG